LVDLNNLDILKEKTLLVSKKDHPVPNENTFLSSKLIDSTISLYQDLINRSL